MYIVKKIHSSVETVLDFLLKQVKIENCSNKIVFGKVLYPIKIPKTAQKSV